ncbi:MAG: hypothetical protein GVX78_01405 [Bacteroidetes bacterium]|nr:hypothetical protein [Bacteroidota bacterium]
MEQELDRIREEKTKEAEDLFRTLGIEPSEEEFYQKVETPQIYENSNSEKKESKFHWTRLSMNSNIGHIIE